MHSVAEPAHDLFGEETDFDRLVVYKTLKNGEVRSRLRQPGIIRMRADWSPPDPVIANYLHRFGRYGIPLDVVYGPRQPQGEALPELLTPSLLLQALDRASAVGPVAAANQGDSSLGQVQKFVPSWRAFFGSLSR